jgi:hypothetical protein
VLAPYGSSKMYPVYGFGAKVKDPSTGAFSVVQHCFPVYGAGLEVSGVDGILQVKRGSQMYVQNPLCTKEWRKVSVDSCGLSGDLLLLSPSVN